MLKYKKGIDEENIVKHFIRNHLYEVIMWKKLHDNCMEVLSEDLD